MNKIIAIIDAQSGSVTIKKVPEHLWNAQQEEIEEYYQIDTSNSDYIVGELDITIEL